MGFAYIVFHDKDNMRYRYADWYNRSYYFYPTDVSVTRCTQCYETRVGHVGHCLCLKCKDGTGCIVAEGSDGDRKVKGGSSTAPCAYIPPPLFDRVEAAMRHFIELQTVGEKF